MGLTYLTHPYLPTWVWSAAASCRTPNAEPRQRDQGRVN